MTQPETRALLLQLLPPGIGKWLDLAPGSDPYLLIDGDAQGLYDAVMSHLDSIAAEADPITITSAGGLQKWESAQGLSATLIARAGADAARRAQVLARLREGGNPTPTNILAALAVACGYTPTIIEANRSSLTTTNTVAAAGPSTIPASGSIVRGFTVSDNAAVGEAGARVDLIITHPHVEQLSITLEGPTPDNATKTWSAGPVSGGGWTNETGTVTTAFYSLASPDFYGKACDGTWQLTVTNSGAGTGTLGDCTLLAEGIGRNLAGAEGKGAAMFEWAAEIDPSLTTAVFDKDAVLVILKRWNPAHANAFLVLTNSNGDLCAIYDDPQSTFDGCTFCS